MAEKEREETIWNRRCAGLRTERRPHASHGTTLHGILTVSQGRRVRDDAMWPSFVLSFSLLFTATTHASGSGQKKRPCATKERYFEINKEDGRPSEIGARLVYTFPVCVPPCERRKRETEGTSLERREVRTRLELNIYSPARIGGWRVEQARWKTTRWLIFLPVDWWIGRIQEFVWRKGHDNYFSRDEENFVWWSKRWLCMWKRFLKIFRNESCFCWFRFRLGLGLG